jgi:N-acetylmuramoyl-L-alanine amidase
MQTKLEPSIINQGMLLNVKRGIRDRFNLRLVFVVKQPVHISGKMERAGFSTKTHLHVVIQAASTTSTQTTAQAIVAIEKDIAQLPPPVDGEQAPRHRPLMSAVSPKKTQPHVVVVIDPGHGGKDPGATGPRGTHEKDVTLAISATLQKLINSIHGMHADLTRSGDYYLSLRQRLDVARQDKADLFIAIHADAYDNTTATGASVYALSERGATSEAARWLAERENYSELGGVKHFSDKSYLVRSVLLDLSQTVTITESLQIGRMMLAVLSQVTPLHHDEVEQARFVVLKSPDIPSLLVETGFITNPEEERLLVKPSFQYKMARAIAMGVVNYFNANPPREVVGRDRGQAL